MEYDRQTEMMNKWEQIRREWLHLDSSVRSRLVENYPDFFPLIHTASMSSITYFADVLTISQIWADDSLPGLKDDLSMLSPRLTKAVKNLAIMRNHDGKVFVEF